MNVYRQGDIVVVCFDPTLGHEPKKSRPALVVSNDDFNQHCSLSLVAPITSRDNGFPMHIAIPDGLNAGGFVCCEQVRAVDLDAREALVIGKMDPVTLGICVRIIQMSF